MLDQQAQLKLQAYLDGELAETEMRQVEEWLRKDSDAQALLSELQLTSAALKGHEAGIRLPESREFYWGKIARKIERMEAAPEQSANPSIGALLRRFLVPAGAAAALLLAAFLMMQSGDAPTTARIAKETTEPQPVAVAKVEPYDALEIETPLEDTEVLAFQDHSEGMTIVWLSYNSQ